MYLAAKGAAHQATHNVQIYLCHCVGKVIVITNFSQQEYSIFYLYLPKIPNSPHNKKKVKMWSYSGYVMYENKDDKYEKPTRGLSTMHYVIHQIQNSS